MSEIKVDPSDLIPTESAKSSRIGLDLNQALELVGDRHWYQKRLMIILGLQWTISAFIIMMQPFLNQEPLFLCLKPDGTTYDCDEKAATSQNRCNSEYLSPNSAPSLVRDLGLYCENETWKSLGGSFFFIGGAVGSILFLYLADRVGRLKILFWSYVLGTIFILILGISDSWGVYYISIALTWAGFDPYFALGTVLVNEEGGAFIRQVTTVLLFACWSIGELLFILIAYFFREWRTQVIYFTGIPLLVLTPLFYWIYESPRYHYAKGAFEAAENVLHKIGKANGLAPTNITLRNDLKFSIVGNANGGFTYLFKEPRLLKRVVFLTIYMFYLYLSYNGLEFGVAHLEGSIYVNSVIVSVAELLGYLTSGPIVRLLNRRKTAMISILFTTIFGFAFLLVPYLPYPERISQAFSLIVKWGISVGFGMMFIYASELFPTEVRSIGVGFCVFLGRLGSILAPYVLQLAKFLGVSQMIFYAALGVVGLFAVYNLPETAGKELTDNLEEEEDTKQEQEILFKGPGSTEAVKGINE